MPARVSIGRKVSPRLSLFPVLLGCLLIVVVAAAIEIVWPAVTTIWQFLPGKLLIGSGVGLLPLAFLGVTTMRGRRPSPCDVEPAALALGLTRELVVLSEDGVTIGWIGQPCEALFGRAAGELLGRPISSLVDAVEGADLSRLEPERLTACYVPAGHGGQRRCEVVRRMVPGDEKWREAFVFREVGERRAGRPVTAEEQRLLGYLVDALPGIFWMFDAHGHLLRWNSNLERVTGYRADELLTLTSKDLIATPEGGLADAFERITAQGMLAGEADLVLRDGSRVRHLCTGRSMEADGRPVVVGTAIDVSDRERAQRLVRQSAVLFHNIFEASPAGLVVLDRAGKVVNASAAFLRVTGMDHDDIQGQPFARVCGTSLGCADMVDGWLHGQAADGGELELSVVGNGSGAKVLRMMAAPLASEDGVGSGLLIVIEDETSRHDYERRLKYYARTLEESGRRQLEAIETERRQISRELHDGIGQLLTSVRFRISAALNMKDGTLRREALGNADKELRQVLEDVRRISRSLRPSLLDDFGLEVAMQWLVDTMIGVMLNRPALNLDIGPIEDRPEPEIETACYRIAQEALTNAVKYAQASCISVALRDHNDGIELLVADDGAGFDVAAASGDAMAGCSCGMLTMRERAQLVGGSLQIDSTVGAGTRITAWLPRAPEQMSLLSKTPDDQTTGQATNCSAG